MDINKIKQFLKENNLSEADVTIELAQMYDDNVAHGIRFVSYVDDGAVENKLILLSKDGSGALNNNYTIKLSVNNKSFNDEKQLVYGVILRKDRPILRNTEDGKFKAIIFPEETIFKACLKFANDRSRDAFDIMHTNKKMKSELFNIWLIDSRFHKTEFFDQKFEDGDLALALYMPDKNDYLELKKSKLKSLSIQGEFAFEELKLSANENTKANETEKDDIDVYKLIEEIEAQLKEMETKIKETEK